MPLLFMTAGYVVFGAVNLVGFIKTIVFTKHPDFKENLSESKNERKNKD